MLTQKRVLAVHDISCFGKCSLTVALPILSAAGLESCCIPTAVLSTHTGGFTGYTYRDLTEDILPVARHWNSINLHFDGVYTGYLGSLSQVEILNSVLDTVSQKDTFVMVDPVMGDDGRLYAGFTEDFPKAMAALCARADIICPNMTEAYLLLGEPYNPGPYTVEEITDLLDRLSIICPKKIVLTGVFFDEHKLGAATFDAETGKKSLILKDKLEGFYHGTGDVYASVLFSALMRGFSLEDATEIATEYTVLSIKTTQQMDISQHYGVNFEQNLDQLIHTLAKKEG